MNPEHNKLRSVVGELATLLMEVAETALDRDLIDNKNLLKWDVSQVLE